MADDDDHDDDQNDDDEAAQRALADAVDQGDDEDDDDDDGSTDESDDDSEDDDEELGDKGKRALDRMKQERKKLRTELADAKQKVKKYEDANKSEKEKLSDDAASYKTRADKAEKDLWRLQIAMDKGLTRKQAGRLTGDSFEDLEADADDLLDLFKDRKTSSKPASKPKEKLSGGGGAEADNDPEETDPKKLAASIPRGRF